MIKTNELRIGNNVQPDKEHAGQFNNIRLWSVTQIYEGGFTVDYHWPGKWFEPVPLSPEILEACGFEAMRPGSTIFRNDTVFLHEYDSGRYRLEEFNVEHVSIEQLHQLQNLFFALTGSELSVNLEKVAT